ncbi:MAG: sigma-54 dependent transcriptional regulator, partial [Deltaproteobacteria bacterium]|nr:sigma-54 dependent transcriptional regulator [Deltaproteobacteria bacterium]
EKASLLAKINIYETKQEEKYEIIGQSRELKECLSQASMVANRNTTILLLGETGTGKECLAHYIHKLSHRKEGPFFPINSGSLSENLLESELFGHERGAFTGATSLKKGIFELADKGTIFLDEIGEISANCQVKLLRVLQDGEILKVGGNKPFNVDVRIIAATNKGLKKKVSEGSFRSDLFYRLSVFPIHLPPLRERKDDIPLLARYLINRHCKKMGRPNLQISDEMIQEFIKYDWPGNVRELENALERAVILAKGSQINHVSIKTILDSTDDSEYSYATGKRLEEMTDAFEKRVISLALAERKGDVETTADKLGVSKSTLYLKIKKYGLTGR